MCACVFKVGDFPFPILFPVGMYVADYFESQRKKIIPFSELSTKSVVSLTVIDSVSSLFGVMESLEGTWMLVKRYNLFVPSIFWLSTAQGCSWADH